MRSLARSACVPPALALLVAGALAPRPALGDVVCVTPAGGAIAGCDLVRTTITVAIEDASPGDVIRVAAGTFVENLSIDANVVLEGGWDAAFTARDPAANPTTIQAAAPESSVVEILGDSGDSASSTPVVDGFTITGANSGSEHGGGVRMHDSNATIRNCVITGNTGYLFGGGIWAQRGAPRIERNRIEGNVANSGGLGGGVSLEGSSATLVDNEIVGNGISESSGLGGGVYSSGPGSVVIRGGRIQGNEPGPACNGDGGGIYASGLASIRIEGVHLEDNCALSGRQGGAAVLDGSPFTLESALVVQRDGTANAVVLVPDTSPGAVRNATFVGDGSGSGLVALSEIVLSSSIFTGFAIAVESDAGIDPPQSSRNIFFANAANTDADWSLDPTDQVVDPLLDSAWHLLAGSPAVDAGLRPPNPTRDVDGDPRVADGGAGRFLVDVGADELAGPAQRNVDLASEPADLEILGPGNPPENPDSIGTNDWIGRAVLAADVSGDGQDDLLLAAQDFADDFDTVNAGGRLFGLLHFGARRTGVVDLASEAADFQVTCSIPLQHVGEELATGDLDDDGVRDLVVGASDTHGDPTVLPKAFVLFGGADLAANGAAIASGALADAAVVAPETSSLVFAGVNALAAGDLSGDGVDDLVVGDASADSPAGDDDGAVYVFFGGPSFSGVHDLASTAADVTFFGESGDASFGSGPYAGGLALGDLDGDLQLDLVIRENAFAHVLYGPLAPGTYTIAVGTQDLPGGDTEVHAIEPGNALVLDATGDGADDLVLDSAGSLLVFAGPLARNQTLLVSAAAYALEHDAVFAAQSLAGADVTGDGRPDVLLGKPDDRTVYAVSPGAYGPGSVPIEEVASWRVTSSTPEAARNVGFDVGGGDLDGDGLGDLVIAAWGSEDARRPQAFRDVGKSFVFYGAAPEPGRGAAALFALLTLLVLRGRRSGGRSTERMGAQLRPTAPPKVAEAPKSNAGRLPTPD